MVAIAGRDAVFATEDGEPLPNIMYDGWTETTLPEIVMRLHRVGLDVPRGTIQGWASKGIVPGPSGGRADRARWPLHALGEIAARHYARSMSDFFVPTGLALRLVSEFVRSMGTDPEAFTSRLRPLRGTRGMMLYGDSAMHNLLVACACVHHKAIHGISVTEPYHVTYHWHGATSAGITMASAPVDKLTVTHHRAREP